MMSLVAAALAGWCGNEIRRKIPRPKGPLPDPWWWLVGLLAAGGGVIIANVLGPVIGEAGFLGTATAGLLGGIFTGSAIDGIRSMGMRGEA